MRQKIVYYLCSDNCSVNRFLGLMFNVINNIAFRQIRPNNAEQYGCSIMIILALVGQCYLQNIVQCYLHLPKEDTLGTAYSKGIAWG